MTPHMIIESSNHKNTKTAILICFNYKGTLKPTEFFSTIPVLKNFLTQQKLPILYTGFSRLVISQQDLNFVKIIFGDKFLYKNIPWPNSEYTIDANL